MSLDLEPKDVSAIYNYWRGILIEDWKRDHKKGTHTRVFKCPNKGCKRDTHMQLHGADKDGELIITGSCSGCGWYLGPGRQPLEDRPVNVQEQLKKEGLI